MLDDVFSFLFFLLLRIIIVVIGIVFVVTCMEDLICIIASFLFYHHPLFLLRHPPSPRPSPRWRTWINQGWQVRPRQNALGRLARFNDLGQRSARCRRCSLGVVGWAGLLGLCLDFGLFWRLAAVFFSTGCIVMLCFVMMIVLLAYPSFIVLYPIYCLSQNSMIVCLFPGSPPRMDIHCFRSLSISSPIIIHRLSTCPPFHS